MPASAAADGNASSEIAHVGASVVAAARAMGLASASNGGSWPVDELPVGLLVLADGGAVVANAGWSGLSGLDRADSLGQGWWAAVHPEDREGVAAAIRLAAVGDETVDWRLAGGEPRWVRALLQPVADGPEEACVMAVVEIDPPRGAAAVAAPGGTATFDSLTGLLDQRSFMAQVARALDADPGGAGSTSAVLFVDLDHFKQVNDAHGHRAGDRVLVAACRRVQSVLRSGDALGRLGGDELAVLMPVLNDPEEATRLAERIVRVCADDFTVDDVAVRVGASVGVAFADGDARSAEALVHNADQAMYQAKAEGRGRWSTFGAAVPEPIRDHAAEARAVLDEISEAIGRAEGSIASLWRDVIGQDDEALSTGLVDASHALSRAARALDPYSMRLGSGIARNQEPAAASPLETWVEVPLRPRTAGPSVPAEADVAGAHDRLRR